MPLRWKVDDEARILKRARFEDEHTSWLNVASFARPLIGFTVFWKSLFELKRNTLAHHTDGVDGIYQRFNVGFKQVSFRNFDHTQLIIPRWLQDHIGNFVAVFQQFLDFLLSLLGFYSDLLNGRPGTPLVN